MLNFAGASFFGIGAYTSAVLNTTAMPHLLVLLLGGLLAATIGSVLLLPVLRKTAELMDDIMLVRERNKNLTIIIVEHEMGVIERITDRCIVRPGRY